MEGKKRSIAKKLFIGVATLGILLFIIQIAKYDDTANNRTGKLAYLITDLTPETYSAETDTGIVFVNVGAPWCVPCRKANISFNEIAIANEGRLKVVCLNAEKHKRLAIEKNVSVLPTLIVYKDGKEVKRVEGLLTRANLQDIVENIEDKGL